MKNFINYDKDMDGQITTSEIQAIAIKKYRLYMTDEELDEMAKVLGMRELDDHVITRDEFDSITNATAIDEYMHDLRENHPKHRDRFSEQVWIRQNDPRDRVLTNLREKVSR